MSARTLAIDGTIPRVGSPAILKRKRRGADFLAPGLRGILAGPPHGGGRNGPPCEALHRVLQARLRTRMRRERSFEDRTEAGRLLAERLIARHLPRPIVLALPRGGVPVGAEIARRLDAPLNLIITRKIGAPDQPELAVGAIAEGSNPEIVLNTEVLKRFAINRDYITAAAELERDVIAQQQHQWASLRPSVDLASRTVIVVDDGLATGMTMRAALLQLRCARPKQVIVAVPVASREALIELRDEARRGRMHLILSSIPGRQLLLPELFASNGSGSRGSSAR